MSWVIVNEGFGEVCSCDVFDKHATLPFVLRLAVGLIPPLPMGGGGEPSPLEGAGTGITCTISATELREKDAIDKKAFTMYTLLLEDAGGRTWSVQRRYSQFDFLRSALACSVPCVLKWAFPPKVSFGNLVDSVVSQRRESLGSWLQTALQSPQLAGSVQLLAFIEAQRGEGIFAVGQRFPVCEGLVDIHGRTFDPAAMTDHIVVYSVGSRYNFQPLTKSMMAAQETLMVKWPSLKMAFVNFADLQVGNMTILFTHAK